MASPSVRRTQIRRAALVLFAERGFYGTSMEDIAGMVGMRAPSLYNHVRSKHELLADIMITTLRELLDTFHDATCAADHQQRLRSAMEAHVRYHATHRDDVRIGNREISSLQQPENEVVRDLRRQYARAWQRLIQAGVDGGAFDTGSAQLAAYALLEMGIGVSQWYREDGEMSLDEVAFHYGEMSLRQLGVSTSRAPSVPAAQAIDRRAVRGVSY